MFGLGKIAKRKKSLICFYLTSQDINDNAVFDESRPFTTYTQPDPVQQYANSYGTDNEANPSDIVTTSTGNVAYPVQYSGIAPYSGYSGYNPGAFSVQSGYEGYLVPGPAPLLPARSTELGTPQLPSLFSGPLSALTSIFPSMRDATAMIGRSMGILLGLIGVTIFGGGVTTALCTFTPLCSISFALPFVGLRGFRDTAKTITDALNIDKTTSENIARAADLTFTAIEKFQKMQKNGDAESNISKIAPETKSADTQVEETKKDVVKIDDGAANNK